MSKGKRGNRRLSNRAVTVPQSRTSKGAQGPYNHVMPPAIASGLQARGMSGQSMLGPGRPIQPVVGYSQPPRSMDFPTGVNISTVSRSAWSRTSFETIRAIIDAYDVARMCINHKTDELRSMELLLQPADGISTDVDGAVDAARAALAFPDRELPYEEWLSKLMENALRYDALPLYRRRNLAGDVIGLEVLDGPTVAPYIDEFGRRPAAPAPAYYQLIQGQIWDWFTADDIAYRRFRPQTNSPYGLAPIESILLSVNTDIRFQWHFLQMFTEGSVPAGFMELPPEVSSPDQVAEWQDYWDAMVVGDQAKLHQIIAVPAGSKLTETRPRAFDKTFPQYLMTRTCGAFGVTPQDLGLVEDVNRANGETQVDIQFRVNTLPWVLWLEGIVSRYLQNDLHLPVKAKLDTGRDKEDRLAEAQAWQIYIDSGMASVDEGRTELLGLAIDNERPMPRFINGAAGPIPLASVFAISGPTDPETAGPRDDQPLSTVPFSGALGVVPDKQPGATQFMRAPIDPDEPRFPELEQPVPGSDVIGMKPGLPVIGQPGATAKKSVDELDAFGRFVKARAKAGKWRDFQFETLEEVAAHRLNDAGRAQVRKAAGELIAAGLCVRAADTGRVLMLQRGLDDTDPAGGTWEFPGGHIDDGETPMTAAVREWQEEVGCLLPVDVLAHLAFQPQSWTSPNGIYQGFVLEVPSESVVDLGQRGQVSNPDDPDGDFVEAIAWFDPAHLSGNPALRPELASDLDVVAAALNPEPVVKAEPADPKAPKWRGGADKVPQHRFDLRITDHYGPQLTDALQSILPAAALHAVVERVASTVAKKVDPKQLALRATARAALVDHAGAAAKLEATLRAVYHDAFASGAHSAGEQLGGAAVSLTGVSTVDWSTWQPGDPVAAELTSNGGLAQLLAGTDTTVQGITGALLDQLGNTIGDGLAAGKSVDSIAKDLAGIIADPSRAEMIAHTETCRAQTAATMATYRANGVTQWNWILSDDACEICIDQEAANPYQVGDDQPPAHPRCRCAASPVTDSIGT